MDEASAVGEKRKCAEEPLPVEKRKCTEEPVNKHEWTEKEKLALEPFIEHNAKLLRKYMSNNYPLLERMREMDERNKKLETDIERLKAENAKSSGVVITEEEFKKRFRGQRLTLIANHKADLDKKLGEQQEKHDKRIEAMTTEIDDLRKKLRESEATGFHKHEYVVSNDLRLKLAEVEEEWKKKLKKVEENSEMVYQMFKRRSKVDEEILKEDYGKRLEAAENAAEERTRYMYNAIMDALEENSITPLRDLDRDGVLINSRWRVSDSFNKAMEEMRRSCQGRIDREVEAIREKEKHKTDNLMRLYDTEIKRCAQQERDLTQFKKIEKEQAQIIKTLTREKLTLQDTIMKNAAAATAPPQQYYPPPQQFYAPPPTSYPPQPYYAPQPPMFYQAPPPY